jgi:hypothetical protein
MQVLGTACDSGCWAVQARERDCPGESVDDQIWARKGCGTDHGRSCGLGRPRTGVPGQEWHGGSRGGPGRLPML